MNNERIIEHISYEIKQTYENADFTLIGIMNIVCKRLIPGVDALRSDLEYVDTTPHILFDADQLVINDEEIYLNHEVFLYQEESLLEFEDSPSSTADGWIEGDWEKIDLTKELPEKLIAVLIDGLKNEGIEIANFVLYVGNKNYPEEFLLSIKNDELRMAYKNFWKDNKDDYF